MEQIWDVFDDEAPAPPPAPAPDSVLPPAPSQPSGGEPKWSLRDAIGLPPKETDVRREWPTEAEGQATASAASSTVPTSSPPAPVAPVPPAFDSIEQELNDARVEQGPAASSSGGGGSGRPFSLADILNKSSSRPLASAGVHTISHGSRKDVPAGRGKAKASQRAPRPAPAASAAPRKSQAPSSSRAAGSGAQAAAEEEEEGEEEAEAEEEEEEEEDLEDELVEDEDELEPGFAEQWPKLKAEPCAPYAPLPLGPRPRHVDGSIYPAEAELNANVNQYLRDYQREGVQWLWKQYEGDRGGILGDEMGLGKTVQVAAFLSAVFGKTATAEDKTRSFPLPAGDCRQALVVVPKSTLSNWQHELKTWGFFRVQCFHGGAKNKEAAMRAASERECEVVLTTYDLVRSSLADFCRINWDVTIWDEVHQIKNQRSAKYLSSMRVPCTRRFGLTGTPMSNEYKELWVLFNFASNGRVGELKDFTQRYSKALAEGLKKSAKQWELQRRLRTQAELKDMMDLWMLQRFKSIIADQMPKKRDNIVFCRLAAEQEEVYMRV